MLYEVITLQRQGRCVIEHLIDIVLLSFLAVTAIAIVSLRDLFAVVMLFGIYSLLSASIFLVLDAVDVSFTEAAVGARITSYNVCYTKLLRAGFFSVRAVSASVPSMSTVEIPAPTAASVNDTSTASIV